LSRNGWHPRSSDRITDPDDVDSRRTDTFVDPVGDEHEALDGPGFKELGKEIWGAHMDEHEGGLCELVLDETSSFRRDYKCICAILEVDQRWYTKLGCRSFFGEDVYDVSTARGQLDAWAFGDPEP